jgi:flagellar hook-associated protein 3 FlgL
MSSPFRITQRAVARSALRNLEPNLARMSELQQQLASGRSIQRPSDSPSGTISALRLRSDLRRSDQLGRNGDDGLGWLGQADNSLTSGLDAVRRARDLTLQGSNAAMGANEREALALEVESIRDGLLSVANTTYLDQPIFAGTAAPTAAFDANGAYQGNAGLITRTVGPGVSVQVNMVGTDVFGPDGDNLFTTLTKIASDLRGNPSQLATADLEKLDEGFLRLQNALSTVGSRYHQVELMQARTESSRVDAKNQLAEVEGVDLPGTIVELQLQEVAYQAALAATAKVIQPSLVDFLR